jgi:predicted RNA-binding Zn-ribbon protein involved in translation (DUF1610 family)
LEKRSGQLSFSIELSMTCSGCHRPVPVDGPVTRVPCRRCGTLLEIEGDYWVETLQDASAAMAETLPGQGSASTFFGRYSGRLTLGRLSPSCGACGKEIVLPRGPVSGEPFSCGECGAALSISPPPSWLSARLPELICFVDAKMNHQSSISGDLVKVSCPSCAAGLHADGSSRLVKCTWCGNSIYLSDSIWSALHGTKRIGRWYAVFQGGSSARGDS